MTLVLLLHINVFAADTGFVDSFKSRIIEATVSAYFALKGYGTVKKIELNSAERTIALSLMPEGETQELNIFVGNYSLVAKEQKAYLVLSKITTNRIWLTRIFADHMPNGISVPLDESMGSFGKVMF